MYCSQKFGQIKGPQHPNRIRIFISENYILEAMRSDILIFITKQGIVLMTSIQNKIHSLRVYFILVDAQGLEPWTPSV